MFNWLFSKKIEDVINQTKKVKVCGVVFTIRKVNVLDHLAGAKVLIQSFDTHKTEGAKALALKSHVSEDKVKRHYADILVSGVVYPKLVHKKADENDLSIEVGDMLSNWELIDALYNEIMIFTYGKKKVQQLISAGNDLSRSTS